MSGYVIVEPNGTIPLHQHEQEEVYYILKGKGEMTVEGESRILEAVSAIYLHSDAEHQLKTLVTDELYLLFVYAPAVIVAHWQKGLAGDLKCNNNALQQIRIGGLVW